MQNDRAMVLAQLRQRVASDDLKLVLRWLQLEQAAMMERLVSAPVDVVQNLQGRAQQCMNLHNALTRAAINENTPQQQG